MMTHTLPPKYYIPSRDTKPPGKRCYFKDIIFHPGPSTPVRGNVSALRGSFVDAIKAEHEAAARVASLVGRYLAREPDALRRTGHLSGATSHV